jgi:N utilization substance protein B
LDYVIKVWSWYDKYHDDVAKHVDKYTESFSYDQMDAMDQSLFLIWYIEWKVLETPKEILLNEMIELAKRYSDDWSPKLINGIMHKIVTEKEEW